DAGAKAAIIASIAFGARIVAGDVYHEGISGITEADIAYARRLGYIVKLLAIVESVDNAIGVRVHPAMVPTSHPLASVRESYNAVFIEGEAVGNLMFYGRGAGGLPTASAVLEGLARDGGLYVPDALPKLPGDVPSDYVDVAALVTGLDVDVLREAYATFDHPDVCPVVQLDDDLWVQELWHGPTLAFKDVALQLVGRLMDAELERRGERRTIVVATSGDTGSAAIAACVGRANLEIVVLHPAGRCSDVQRKQMTTVQEPNVHN